MNIKHLCKRFFSYGSIFFVCICSYLILLTLINLIPTELLLSNLKKSSETLINENEKQYVLLPHKAEMLFYYSDTIILNMIASVDSSHPFESGMLSRKSYLPNQEQEHRTTPTVSIPADRKYLEPDINCLIREFYGMMHGDEIDFSWEYARYWHGHQILVRPLLLLLDLEGIRIFLFFSMALLFGTFLYFLSKKLGIFTAIIFALGLLSSCIFTMTRSINESLLFLFTLGSMIFLLFHFGKDKNFGPYFFILGSIINFFDLLTSPIIGCLLPLTLYLLLEIKENKEINIKTLFNNYIIYGILWLAGYGLTWIAKWIFVDLIYNRGIISQAISQVFVRSTDAGFTLTDVFERVYLFLSPTVIIISIISAIILGLIQFYKNRKNISSFRSNAKYIVPFYISALIPFIWCFVVRNHAFLHPFFTYRLFSITIIQICLIPLIITGYYFKQDKNTNKKILKA